MHTVYANKSNQVLQLFRRNGEQQQPLGAVLYCYGTVKHQIPYRMPRLLTSYMQIMLELSAGNMYSFNVSIHFT
jgi:hypothetical protein